MSQKLEPLFPYISIQSLKIQKQNSYKFLESQVTSSQKSWNFSKVSSKFSQNF